MREILAEYDARITNGNRTYLAQACGAQMSDGLWEGWIEFLPNDGSAVLRTDRETTQPNRQDTEYWATGVTAVYLEGALQRAIDRTDRDRG